MNPQLKQSGGLHRDHRHRVREKIIHYGPESFVDHELLELLLFAASPRGNTNELAHLAIERFGSIYAVLEASADELMEIEGIGEAGAAQILAIAEVLRRYVRSCRPKRTQYDTVRKIAEYLWSYFCALDHERLYMMVLDNRMALIDVVTLSDGTIGSTEIPTRRILEVVVRKKAAYVVLAHNHPHGVARASKNDVDVTQRVSEMLNVMNVMLLEHIVVAEDSFYPILRHEKFCPNPISEEQQLRAECFDAEHFYDVDDKTYRFSDFFTR